MEQKISGFAFHCHHDVLVEWVTDFDERVNYIKALKLAKEQELRLRLFRMIPTDRIPIDYAKAHAACSKDWAAYVKAWAAYNKAKAACDKDWVAYVKAWVAYSKAFVTYYKAKGTYNKAKAACDKARAAYDTYFEGLHKELCPNCPWDGETILSAK